MRRNTLLICVGAVTVLAVGCHDAVVEPNRSINDQGASAALKSGLHEQTLIGTLQLSPNGGTYHVGDFDVVIPAGAVCDPRTAKYGPKHWDDDCTPATRSVTVNVVAETRQGHVSVDFQPDLRFRPSAGEVRLQTSAFRTLLTSDQARSLSPTSSYFSQYVIYYVPTGKSDRIDEVQSTGDASLTTHVDLRTGLVWRRVKHFSGYITQSGDRCDPSVITDGSCLPDNIGLGGLSNTIIPSGGTWFSMPSVIVTP